MIKIAKEVAIRLGIGGSILGVFILLGVLSEHYPGVIGSIVAGVLGLAVALLIGTMFRSEKDWE